MGKVLGSFADGQVGGQINAVFHSSIFHSPLPNNLLYEKCRLSLVNGIMDNISKPSEVKLYWLINKCSWGFIDKVLACSEWAEICDFCYMLSFSQCLNYCGQELSGIQQTSSRSREVSS